MGRIFESICLFVCLFVCSITKTNYPKEFKLGIGNDFGITCFGVERPTVSVRIRVTVQQYGRGFELYECLLVSIFVRSRALDWADLPPVSERTLNILFIVAYRMLVLGAWSTYIISVPVHRSPAAAATRHCTPRSDFRFRHLARRFSSSARLSAKNIRLLFCRATYFCFQRFIFYTDAYGTISLFYCLFKILEMCSISDISWKYRAIMTTVIV